MENAVCRVVLPRLQQSFARKTPIIGGLALSTSITIAPSTKFAPMRVIIDTPSCNERPEIR
jgi:hypothetical protein